MNRKQNALNAVTVAGDSYRHARDAYKLEQEYLVSKFKKAKDEGATLVEIAQAAGFAHQYVSRKLRER